MSVDIKFEGRPLTKLPPATQDEVRDIIIKSPSKSCELDPLPTYLFKEVLEYLLPLITAIINKSLVESKVPLSFKKANIKPLLMKPNLDKQELNNYRLVSNLPFLLKIPEKLDAWRLETHLSGHRLQNNLQSAYRTGHSTETALLKVHHDIAEALDRKCMAEPEKVKGTTAHYKHTFIDSVVTYVANYGYRFQYGEKARTIICLPNGKWNI